VLDWINARAGDPRADVARSATILRLDDCRPDLRNLPVCAVLRLFERGWRAGYTCVTGWPADLAPFYAWAGAVMEHDLAHKRPPEFFDRVRAWTRHWQTRATRRE
jgi:hypothetical protein